MGVCVEISEVTDVIEFLHVSVWSERYESNPKSNKQSPRYTKYIE